MPPEMLSPLPEIYEISLSFRHSLEARIAKLEYDASIDEDMLARIEHPDHLRRHRRLVDVQRAEAERMRLFLTKTRTRAPRRKAQAS
jgi:uncharacterized coiled-coil protein SlyX